MKVLITGFDPFGGESINPAWEAVKLLPDEIAGAQIVKLQIPTVVNKSIQKIYDSICAEKPDIVLSIGQAGGRFAVTPERVAINITDARIPDNEGNQPIDVPIFEDGDAAYFSNLPVKAMVQAIKDAGYPSVLSNTAGTYICNHVMYGILYYIKKEFPNIRGGFIHVPYAASQVVNKPATPSMSLADIAASIEAAVKAAVENQTDIKAVGGEIH
ncbi:MAG: pyroglutamyl-peptidase I [Lachnospiraceae bacterium]|jgi:pyroglutamyl-peptidase|nr:pyroglutamyl-peptidase I [Lachnospiraceae bacterium]NBJ83101.1 pyroglutamyl-peptidase I [bacterium 1XD42-76]NBK06392.1 pyroglutamyl-peptidase I [bacterium 1XD42-94]